MKTTIQRIFLAATFAALLLSIHPYLAAVARAQAPAAAPPAAAPAATPAPTPPITAREMTLWQWFVVGGWCMWPLLACSVACVGLIIRNHMVLQPQKLLRPDLLEPLQQSLAALDVGQARQLCQANPSLMTTILDVGLARAEVVGLDFALMEKAMEEASTEQMSAYMLPINSINTIAVVAPMLGLLGTVSGMIKAFFNISLGGMGKPEMLANNIGEALITTEAGLVIAIPAMAYYFFFKNRFVATVASAGKMIGQLLDATRANAGQANR